MKIVGTPKNIVMRSRPIASSTWSGTKRRNSTSVAPANTAAFMM